MKRILISLMTIAVVGTVGFVGTKAYFTDTESSNNNTFSTGTIDIAVDGQNPWNRATPYQLTDMKPSQVDYANFVIHNVGTNPVNVTKRLNVNHSEGDNSPVSEPECLAEDGQWSDNECLGGNPVTDVENHINYDMTVWVYDVDPAQNPEAQAKWWQIIYTDEMNKTLGSLNGQDIILGMIPQDWYMKVEQSYHMPSDTGNEYQGDNVAFDITLDASQLTGTVVLENKDFADQVNPTIKHDDGIQGTLTYGVKDSKFDFSFAGTAPLPSTNYSLIFYEESWSTPSGSGWPRPVIVLGTTTSDGSGNVSIPSTLLELNQDILNMKVWLVKSSDLVGSTLNTFVGNDYLFETGLIDYYDSDL